MHLHDREAALDGAIAVEAEDAVDAREARRIRKRRGGELRTIWAAGKKDRQQRGIIGDGGQARRFSAVSSLEATAEFAPSGRVRCGIPRADQIRIVAERRIVVPERRAEQANTCRVDPETGELAGDAMQPLRGLRYQQGID